MLPVENIKIIFFPSYLEILKNFPYIEISTKFSILENEIAKLLEYLSKQNLIFFSILTNLLEML